MLVPGEYVYDGYRILDHLNRSKAADTYDVWDEQRNCRCIAKILRPDRADDDNRWRRLIFEGELLGQLQHPGIVRLYESRDAPRPLLILEHVGGLTVERLIRIRAGARPRPETTSEEIASLGFQLAAAIGYVHRRGYLHLDLKPANVLFDGNRAVVIDFGLARVPGPGRPGVGTRRYMAPEQARNEHLTAATDCWAIGVILYELASGQWPYHDGGEQYPQLVGDSRDIRELRDLPPALADTIAACLHPDPGHRPLLQTVMEMLAR